MSNCASPTITTSASGPDHRGGRRGDQRYRNPARCPGLTCSDAGGGHRHVQRLRVDRRDLRHPAQRRTAGDCSTGGTSSDPTYTSATYLPTSPGSYKWVATFAGDNENNAVAGVCGDPPRSRSSTRVTPTAATTLKNAATNATVADGSTSARLGHLRHRVDRQRRRIPAHRHRHLPLLHRRHCATGTPTAQSSVALVAGIATSSRTPTCPPATTPSTPSTSQAPTPTTTTPPSAPASPSTSARARPARSTTLKNAATDATVADGSTLTLGSGIYDTATIGNAGGFPLTGTVTFRYYTGGNCATGTPDAQSSVALVAGVATSSVTPTCRPATTPSTRSTSQAQTPTTTTPLSAAASPSTSARARPAPRPRSRTPPPTRPSPTERTCRSGSGLYDTASIGNAGGFPLTGTVTFKFFTSTDCTGAATTHAGVAAGSPRRRT